ncbi:hypothetical protein [Streptomyces sp. NPDC002187]|uniref:hypothetical protein n=1 Tax=Streptomyces sp. NPDC002187 TaxID=3364637 RepID=UPI00369B503A
MLENWSFPGEIEYQIEADEGRLPMPSFYSFTFAETEEDRESLLRSGRRINYVVGQTHFQLEAAVRICRAPRIVRPILPVPAEAHPPQRGQLNHGIQARLLSEDLSERIKIGQALDAQLANGLRSHQTVESWSRETQVVLSRLRGNCVNDFSRLAEGARNCASPTVPDPATLGRAYLALGLEYLKEVLARIPAYTVVGQDQLLREAEAEQRRKEQERAHREEEERRRREDEDERRRQEEEYARRRDEY